ncbi:Chromosome partition protein smc [Labilithrix luteola]|uniref:Chromosome partition protein smc n=1 Tax=Labilithrix luteola TaxID=1391654 RepID=A0A0K1QCE8_9BACT|nr:Chromosome partition protein smc [Labilithrix luteola]
MTGVACQPQAPKAVVPFVENDFARALAEAKATGRPLFVEVGTAWCPPCQQLAREVFPDPALATLRDAFVWLSIDADASSNEPFLARFPARGFPTLYVIEPASEKVVVTEAGGTTTSMLRVMLLASQKAIAMARTNPKDDATAAERWSSALDAASQDAPGLDLRIAFDRRRLLAYAALGAVERILPSLERSEHDLPTSADPPMLIAYVDWKLGRLDDARGALARAKMRLAGEPAQRTLDVYLLEADVARAAGDVRGERAALVEGLARTKGAPLSKAEDASRNKLRLRLSSLPP